MKISKKIVVMAVAGSAIPLILFGAITLWQGSKNEALASRESVKLAFADLDHVVGGVQAMLASQQLEFGPEYGLRRGRRE